MSDTKSDLENVLEGDQQNIQAGTEVLQHFGIYELYGLAPILFDELLVAVQNSFPEGAFPFSRKTPDGTVVPTYDFMLRTYMVLSAQQQFFYAAGHFLRGHLTEVGGHARRAIEGAGIAYLSKSKPEIADYFQARDRQKLRNSTGTNKILPKDNPLTAPLNNSIEYANSLVHNNFFSFASRLEPSFHMEGTKWTFECRLYVHEASADDLQTLLNTALWLLRVMERVARLLAASFDLPSCDWFNKLDDFKGRLDKLYADLRSILDPNYQPT